MTVVLRMPLPAAARAAVLAPGILDHAAMQERAAAWDRLAAAAVYPNPFHSRALMAAHAELGILAPGLRFVVAGGDGELDALLPFVPNGAWTGTRRSHAVWLPPHFAVNATPLVRRDAPDEAMEILLARMGEAGTLWRFPLLALDAPVGRALVAACARRGFAAEPVCVFERAVLNRRPAYDAYARNHLGAGRRKGLRRQRRRLEERGRVSFASFTQGEGLRSAVEAFLALEAAGWKGRRGTALAAGGPGPALTRALFGASQDGGARADVLSLDERPVAVSLALLAGGTAFLLKTAYDEAFRAFAPGILLEDSILRDFLDGGFADKLDSASLPGCVLEEMFADRERIADLVVATDRAISQAALQALVRQERARQAAARRLKGWYWRLVDWAAGARQA